MKYGTSYSTVPLFKATKNKELVGKSSRTGGTIVLSDLLKSVGITTDRVAADSTSASLCKKCARKVVNCCTLYHELEAALNAEKKAEHTETVKVVGQQKGDDGKRFHGQSPSGLTPSRKKKKKLPIKNVQMKSRKSLFELQSSWSEKENIHDELANMMCLPVTENESNACTVKVS